MARTDELDKAANRKSLAKESAAAAKSRLDDPAVQEAIREPKPFSVQIAGEDRVLHALSAKKNRELDGLFRLVLADTIGGGATESIRSLRMVGILLDGYSDRAITILAAATEPAGGLSDAGIVARAKDIDESISAQELADAFVAICDRERVLERFTKVAEAADALPK